jgi:hypothetical protein
MLQQASAEEPARFEVRLRNVGSKTVTLGMGPTLLFSDTAATDGLQWADAIVIGPETYIGPWEDPFRTDDGCWRYPNEGYLVQSILEEIEVAPGDSITETYEVYTSGKTRSCLPKGRYYFQDKNGFRSGLLQGTANVSREARDMILTVVLQIDGEHRITVQAQKPAIEA